MKRLVLPAVLVAWHATFPAWAADPPRPDVPASTGTMTLRGLSEVAFNPLAGSFEVEIRGARLAERDGAVTVWLNDEPLDPRSVHVGPRSVTVDYRLRPGVNDLLVEARDTAEAALRADALVWAGEGSFTVDVVDHKQRPLSGVQVTVSLAEQTSVRERRTTASGTVRFENVPPGELTVTAQYRGRQESVVYSGRGGSILMELDTR